MAVDKETTSENESVKEWFKRNSGKMFVVVSDEYAAQIMGSPDYVTGNLDKDASWAYNYGRQLHLAGVQRSVPLKDVLRFGSVFASKYLLKDSIDVPGVDRTALRQAFIDIVCQNL